MANKPWRPIPSKRISQRSARILRWALVPACALLSLVLQVPEVSTILSIGIFVHNDLGWGSHWLPKALCNVVAYVSMNSGASMVTLSGTFLSVVSKFADDRISASEPRPNQPNVEIGRAHV